MRAFSPLFATPSAKKGFARSIDFFGQLSNLRRGLDDVLDAVSIGDDWQAVGEDLRKALREESSALKNDRQLKLFD